MFGALRAHDPMPVLLAIAREFSPRVEPGDAHEVTLDLGGLDRLIGDAPTIAWELRRTAAGRGVRAAVAVAGTRTTARLLAAHAWHRGVAAASPRPDDDLIVVAPGDEEAALAPVPIEVLPLVANGPEGEVDLVTLRRWGVRTLGDLAALPADDLAARLGAAGVRWRRLARGEDPRPLMPAVPEERFEQAFDLEWPIDGLEPLSFVLGRLMEPLSAHLERRGRGAAVLHVRLHLVTRTVHARSLQLPAPIRDARTLRTLALLDLESHPPDAAVDRVVVAVDPTPGRVLQFSLLTRPLPSPERLSTLLARLGALMGEGRCGSPEEVATWCPGAGAVRPFAPAEPGAGEVRRDVNRPPAAALRRFRAPVAARVRVEAGKPAWVHTDRRGLGGGRVQACAGPWRTSGAWWGQAWDRDEWDVALHDGATYRLYHDRERNGWFLEGIVD